LTGGWLAGWLADNPAGATRIFVSENKKLIKFSYATTRV